MDKSSAGPDHWFSANPSELKIWCNSIRTSYDILGNSDLVPTKSEIQMKSLARRSIIALKDIEVGEILNKNNIGLRRPGTGLQPKMFESILGKKTLKKIKKNTLLTSDDFKK